jgi:hypothetical protein
MASDPQLRRWQAHAQQLLSEAQSKLPPGVTGEAAVAAVSATCELMPRAALFAPITAARFASLSGACLFS